MFGGCRFVHRALTLSRISNRSCFIAVYGRNELGPRPIPSHRYPISNPNYQKQQWTTHEVPEDRIEFVDTLSSAEIRLLELAKYDRLNEVMYKLQGGMLINHQHVADRIAKRLARYGRTSDILMVIEQCRLSSEPDLRQALFYSYTVEGDIENAEKVYRDLKETKTLVSPAHQQAFLRLLCKSAGVDKMVNIAKEYGVIPSLELHDDNIDDLLCKREIKMAYEYLDFMRILGTEPDTQILNKFILYHVYEGELQAAEDVLMEMKPPTRPNLDSFHKLTVAYAMEKNLEKVDYFMWRVGRRQMFIDRKMYADLLCAFAMIGEHKRIEKTLYRMRREGLEPKLDAFNGILKGYAEVGDFKHVNLTFDELRFKQFDVGQEVPKIPGQFERPDAETFHLILSGYSKNKMFYHGVEMFRFMRGRKIEPLPETVPIIQEMLSVTKSVLPLDIHEKDDVNARSIILNHISDDTVSHEHSKRYVVDIWLPRFTLPEIQDKDKLAEAKAKLAKKLKPESKKMTEQVE